MQNQWLAMPLLWFIAIALGFTTALIHLPIDDKPLARKPAT